MNNMKVWTQIVTVLLILLCISIACSNQETNSSDASGTEGNSSGESTGEQTNIRFTIWYGPGDIDVWNEVINEFEADNPDIKVEFEPVEFGTYWQRLQTQLAANAAADVVGSHVGIVFDYVDKEQLLPLDTYLEGSQYSISEIPEALTEEGAWPKDHPAQYALPWRFVGGTLYINKTAFEEAGLDYPSEGWTIEEFVSAASQLTTSERYGFRVPQHSMSAGLMGAFGAAPVTEDRLASNYASPEVLSYYQWAHDLIHVHGVAINPLEIDEGVDPFVSGKVAMQFQGSWNIPVYREIEDFEWDIAPVPTLNGQSKTYAGPDMLSISKDSKNPEAAWRFIEFAVFNEKAQELLSTTGLPILTKDILNQDKIDAVAAQKPEHYHLFLEGAVNNGTGYAFTTKFFEISQLENDANYLIYTDKEADIEKILEDLHQNVNTEFSR